MSPPAGTRCLFLSCLDADQPQFRGMRRAMDELGAGPGCCTLVWRGTALRLRGRRVLRRVLIAGHGREERAGYAAGVPGACRLDPRAVTLPGSCSLFLLGCYQGAPEHRRAWAAGTGLAEARVHGSGGETESALSTCLLLHLMEEGPESLERWFPAWRAANDRLRPHFPRMRRAYAENAGDPLCTLEQLRDLWRDEETARFIGVIARHPEYLRDLG